MTNARGVAVLAGSALSAASFVGLVGSAGAAVPAKKLCAAFQDVGGSTTEPSTTEEGAAEAAKIYKKLSKAQAPKKVKKALKAIVRYLNRVADGASPEDLGDEVESYARAYATFNAFVLKECLGDKLEGIEDQLPEGITLPE